MKNLQELELLGYKKSIQRMTKTAANNLDWFYHLTGGSYPY